LYVISQLLLIFDVESASAAAAVGYGRLARWLMAQALSCRVVLGSFRRLDDVIDGLVDHVGICGFDE